MRIRAQGEGGIVVELGDAVDEVVNARVHLLARAVRRKLGGAVKEVVPSYRSLLVLHDPLEVPRARLVKQLTRLLDSLAEAPPLEPARVVSLPVCYGGELGPDLEELARHAGLTPAEVVALHSAPVYRVHMLGFTPGFPYLGGLSPRLFCPRLSSPRTRTAPGSVAIGGEQTGVYTVESPGGWRILGRTPLRLFDPSPGSRRPFLLSAGDGLRFAPIDRAAYDALAAEVEAGGGPPATQAGPRGRAQGAR